MKSLRVTNIQRGCVYDGPGVRTTVFLKGCSLHCPWCCNPETISYEEQWFIDDGKCLHKKGLTSNLCEGCEWLQGERPVNECPFGVAESVSKDYTPEELYDIILKDKNLYKTTDGGVTFSGGEPLLQAKELVVLLDKLKKNNINVAFETSLFVSEENLKLIIPYSDLFFVDLKLQPQMFLGNRAYFNKICKKLALLSEKRLIFRMVFVNKAFDKKDEILTILKNMNVHNIEILLCHNLGLKKYQKLSKQYVDYSSEKTKAKEFCDFINNNMIHTTLLSI